MTNTTDLATVATQLPAHLRGAKSTAATEFSGGIGQGLPLAFLSVRGKEFRLRKDGQELNTRQRDLSVILVAARHTLSKRYYESKYVTGSLEAPDCSSKDSVTPDVSNPVHSNCQHCPKNQWGSRITESGKEGKACSDYKRVIMLPVGIGTDEPLILDVAATSLKAPKGQRHTVLMFGDYMSQLAKHGMDPTQVVTKMSFTDAEYPQLCFTFERFVTEEEWLRIQELRDSDDVSACIDEDGYETGTVTEQPLPDPEPVKGQEPGKPKAAPKPKPEPEPEPEEADTNAGHEAPAEEEGEATPEEAVPEFPGTPTIMKDGDNLTIAQDEETWTEAWLAGYRPQAAGKPKKAEPKKAEPKPKAEAKPAPAKEEPGEGDLLSEVAALLGKK